MLYTYLNTICVRCYIFNSCKHTRHKRLACLKTWDGVNEQTWCGDANNLRQQNKADTIGQSYEYSRRNLTVNGLGLWRRLLVFDKILVLNWLFIIIMIMYSSTFKSIQKMRVSPNLMEIVMRCYERHQSFVSSTTSRPMWSLKLIFSANLKSPPSFSLAHFKFIWWRAFAGCTSVVLVHCKIHLWTLRR